MVPKTWLDQLCEDIDALNEQHGITPPTQQVECAMGNNQCPCSLKEDSVCPDIK